MSKDEPTNGELKIMLDNVKDSISRIEESTKTISRGMQESSDLMNNLKVMITQMSETIQKHDKALFEEEKGVLPIIQQVKGSIKFAKVLYPLLIVLMSAFIGLYVKDLKSVTAKEVITQLEEKYNLEIIQNESKK